MRDKKIASIAVQIVYTLLCAALMIVSVLYDKNIGTQLGILYADIAFYLSLTILYLPMPALSYILNIWIVCSKSNNGSRLGWLIWSFFSSALYMLVLAAAIVIYVTKIGGV